MQPAKARKRLRLLFRRDIIAAFCFLRDPFHPFLLGFVIDRIGITTLLRGGALLRGRSVPVGT